MTSFSHGQEGYGSTYQADVAIPLGVFSDAFLTGYGVHAEFYMETESYVRINALLGFTRWGLDNDKINQRFVEEGGKGTLQLDGHMAAIPLLLGVRFLSPAGGLRVYGLLEGGVYLASGSVTGQRIENGIATENIDKSMTKFEPGFDIGGGLLVALSPSFSIDLTGRYHLLSRDTFYTYDIYGNPSAVSTDKYLTIALGVTYSFSASEP